MKRRLKQPETVFIGLGSEDDGLLVTIDNQSGAVGLEWVGKEQHDVLSDSLAAWLDNCQPQVETDKNS